MDLNHQGQGTDIQPRPCGIAGILYVKELNIVAPAYTLIQGSGWPWPFNIKTRLKEQGLQKAGI